MRTANSGRWLAGCCALSGAAGLIHELVWTRRLELLLGSSIHTAAASLAVTMGGMAIGAAWAGRREERTLEGARAYGTYEILLALYCLLLPLLYSALGPVLGWIRPLVGGSFGLASTLAGMTLVVPAAFLMGATFPPLVADRVRAAPDRAVTTLARFYGLNVLGAFAGVLAGGLILRPALGTRGTLLVASALCLVAGVLARRIGAAPVEAPAPEPRRKKRRSSAPTPAAAPVRRSTRVAYLVYALSGFTALAFEVLLHRMASLWIGGSSYAFAMVLAAFLLGISLGSLWIRDERFGPAGPLAYLARLQRGVALWVVLLAWVAGALPLALARFASFEGLSFPALLALEFTAIFVLVLPGSFCLGASLPTAAACLGTDKDRTAGIVSRLYVWNAAGSVLGALSAAHLFVPLMGLRGALLSIAGINLLAGMVADVARMEPGPDGTRTISLGSLAATSMAGALLVTVPAWDAALLSSGPYMYASIYRSQVDKTRSVEDVIRLCGEVVFHKDGAFTTTTVRRAEGGLLSLQVNGKTDASNRADQFTQTFIAHLAMLARPEAKDALCIGLGSGASAGAYLAHPIERLDVVEIAPEVVEASRFFDEITGAPLDDPRTTLHLEDARSFVRWTDRRFDVITSEPSNPWIAGMANLFTREYFRQCRARLREGGVMVQWLQAYSIAHSDFAGVLATFQETFPHVTLFRAENGVDYVLLGSADPAPLDGERLEELLAGDSERSRHLRADGLTVASFARAFVTDTEGVARLAAGAQIVTDDDPFLEFTTPANLYRDQTSSITRALAEVKGVESLPRAVAAPGPFLAYLQGREGALDDRDRAVDLALEGKYAEARELLEAALRSIPDDVAALDAYTTLVVRDAELSCQAGDHRAAAGLYTTLLTHTPDNVEARNNRAHCLADLGELEESRDELLEVVQRAPGHRVALRNLSSVLYRLGDVKGALGAYTHFLNGTRPGPKEWKELGELYRDLGNFPKAAFAWKRSLELDPEQESVRHLLEAYVEVAGAEGIATGLDATD